MRIFKRRKTKSFKFQPFSKKQKQLLYWWEEGSPHKDMDMVIADGAIRSGKTIAMICSFLRWSQENHEGEDFIIAGKSIGSLKRNVIKPMQQILGAWGWKYHYNRSENYLTIGSNTYYLFGASTEASQDTLQGLTAAGALADEVALFPRSFVDQMIGRCSVEGYKIFMNCNPGSPFHYIKTEFIDKANEKRILRLHFTMDDNLTLSENRKQGYFRMYGNGVGVFFQRYILGLWVQAEGTIFDMFNKDKHSVKTIRRRYDTYYVSVDYGTQNAMAMGLWGHYDGIWYKIKEYHYSGRDKGRQKTDTEYADDFENFVGDLPIRRVIIDPSAASFKAELKKRGYICRNAKNNVIDGIRLMATALNEEKVMYNDVCVETFKEFASYVWNEKSALRGVEEPVQANDHHMDSDRYFIATVVMIKSPVSF